MIIHMLRIYMTWTYWISLDLTGLSTTQDSAGPAPSKLMSTVDFEKPHSTVLLGIDMF